MTQYLHTMIRVSDPDATIDFFKLIGLEEVLKASTDYWKLIEGLIVIAIVLMLPNGVRQLMPLVFGPSDEDAPVREKNSGVKSAAGASHG